MGEIHNILKDIDNKLYNEPEEYVKDTIGFEYWISKMSKNTHNKSWIYQ